MEVLISLFLFCAGVLSVPSPLPNLEHYVHICVRTQTTDHSSAIIAVVASDTRRTYDYTRNPRTTSTAS